MNDETNSGAASQVSPPRAFQPVTRGGVATGQLRDLRSGRFGGRAERPTPVPFDETLVKSYQPIVYEQPDAAEGYREMVSEQDKASRLLTVAIIALVVGIVAYFAWQFFLRF